MSGGSLNYLYLKEDIGELQGAVSDMEEVESFMLEKGNADIAMDIRRLIEYIKTATNRIECLAEKLSPIFKAVEWFQSADSGMDSVDNAVNEYRKRE